MSDQRLYLFEVDIDGCATELYVAACVMDTIDIIADLGVNSLEDAASASIERLPDEKKVTLRHESGGLDTRTAAEWVVHNGRGALASSEW